MKNKREQKPILSITLYSICNPHTWHVTHKRRHNVSSIKREIEIEIKRKLGMKPSIQN